jgi:hypothetical protein
MAPPPAKLEEAMCALNSFRVADLKSVLRTMNMTLSGIKGVLKNRVITFMNRSDAQFEAAYAAIMTVHGEGGMRRVRTPTFGRHMGGRGGGFRLTYGGGDAFIRDAAWLHNQIRSTFQHIPAYRPVPVRKRLAQEDIAESLR